MLIVKVEAIAKVRAIEKARAIANPGSMILSIGKGWLIIINRPGKISASPTGPQNRKISVGAVILKGLTVKPVIQLTNRV